MLRKKLYVKVNILTLVTIISLIIICVHYLSSVRCASNNKIKSTNLKLKYRLIVLILSSPDHLAQRDTIRKTWLSEKYSDVKYLFALGTLDIHPDQRVTLQSEKQKFNDLLLLPKLQDSYATLTKKILHAFLHLYEEYDFNFLLKCDHDSFALLNRILIELDRWESKDTKKHLYWGFFNGRAQVKRSGPWRETDWILCDYYLPYALGGGYVLSYKLVEFIAKNADVLK